MRSASFGMGMRIGIASALMCLAFAGHANAQACTAEQVLAGQVFSPAGAPANRCETSALLLQRATTICKHTVGAVGAFRVEAGGCARDYGQAVFTCCPSAAQPPVKLVPKPPSIAIARDLGRTPIRPPEGRHFPKLPYVSPIFLKPLNAPGQPLRGYVDLHTHLMNHLGFGGKLLYGGTDPGVQMPSGTIWRPPCPSGFVEDSPGLCYSKCPDGYRGVGPSCYPLCPAGWPDAGLTCTPPSYGRGVGYVSPPSVYARASKGRGNGYSWDPWAQRHNPEPPQGRNMSNGFDRCRYDHGENGCEEGTPGIWYPKCDNDWEGIVNVCWERCRAGYGQVGLTCSRDGIDVSRDRCAADNPQGCEQIGAIIYPRCKAGYQAFALTCTQTCPANTSNAGLLCTKNLLARSGPQTISKTCNAGIVRAADIGEALGSCASTHGGWDAFTNTCGDTWRNFVVGKFAEMAKHTVTHDPPGREALPSFARWPKWNDIHHQQMWVEWVKRAHDGGLRVMVALAGNSLTLARAINGNEPYDDKSEADLQLEEMQAYAIRNSSFVEIAKSAADLRRIVGQDKLAIVPGIEVDHLGGFGNNAPDPTPDQVRAEIRRLYGKGVRYVLPIHAANNSFGGTALYEEMFLFANLFQTGSQIDAVCAETEDGIRQRVNVSPDLGWLFDITHELGIQRFPKDCDSSVGFKNERKLQPLGKVAIDEMMTLGILVDVDHGGEVTTRNIVDYTNGASSTGSGLLQKSRLEYPLLTGHNGPRSKDPNASERSLPDEDFVTFANRGSISGLGSDGVEAGDWIEQAKFVTSLGMPIAFGSDVNGMANLPRPPWVNVPDSKPLLEHPPAYACAGSGSPRQCVEYLNDDGSKPAGSTATFKRARSGGRTWDYNTEGVANFGLFPDFLKDVERRPGGTDVVTSMYEGAEKFAQSWTQAEAIGAKIRSGH